jgi:hypothetical protein
MHACAAMAAATPQAKLTVASCVCLLAALAGIPYMSLTVVLQLLLLLLLLCRWWTFLS